MYRHQLLSAPQGTPSLLSAPILSVKPMQSSASNHLARFVTRVTRVVKKLSYLTLPPCSRRDHNQSRPSLTVWMLHKHSTCKKPGAENMTMLSRLTTLVSNRDKLTPSKRSTLEGRESIPKVTTLMTLISLSGSPTKRSKWTSNNKTSKDSRRS